MAIIRFNFGILILTVSGNYKIILLKIILVTIKQEGIELYCLTIYRKKNN